VPNSVIVNHQQIDGAVWTRERDQRQVIRDGMGPIFTIWQLVLLAGQLVGDGIDLAIGSWQLQPAHRLKLVVHHQQLAGHGG
jgi:hypothetical protein